MQTNSPHVHCRSARSQPGRRIERRCGSAAVAALAALVIILVIVLGLMTAAMQTVLRGNQQRNASAATYAAEAGVQYGYWQFMYNSVGLPYSGAANLPGGSFTVQVTDNSSTIGNTIKVTATGSCNTASASLTRIYNVPLHIFDYALLVNQSISTNCYPILGSGGSGGDIRANGSISLPNAQTKINGTATATGSISIPTVTGTTSPNNSLYTFPAVSTSYYQSVAGISYVYSGVAPPIFFQFGSANEIVFVTGNVIVSPGTVISGTGTFIVNGNLTFSGAVTNAANSHAAFIVLGTLTISSSVTTMAGNFYVHNSFGTATTVINSGITAWTGSLATDKITFNNNSLLTMTKDPFFSPSQGRTMHIPGY